MNAATLALLAALTLGQATALPAQAPPDFRTENLRAFAKLYGYVRWFHPSDEASAIDWDRFAIHGAADVAGLSATDDLRARLDALFLPIAPAIAIFSDAAPPSDPPHTPAGEEGLELVAWQHRGVGLGQRGPYQSARLNRATEVAGGSSFGGVGNSLDATPYRGKELRLTAQAKAAPGSQVQLWVRIDRAPSGIGFFENMDDRPIRATEWKTYEIVGTIAADASRIVFGGFLPGKGEAWLDEFTLSVREPGESWTPLPLANPGFEAGESGVPPQGWGGGAPASGYESTTTDADPAEGKRALRIRSVGGTTLEQPLFASHPQPHEFVDVTLGRGLRARIPLALYSRDGHTLPASSTEALASLQTSLGEIAAVLPTDRAVRIAAVTIAWNIFQHFYPYFDVVETDWDAVLTESLARAMTDETAEDFDETLRWLIAQLHDGHGYVHHPALVEGRLPFLSDWIEGQAVVVANAPDAVVQRGDVVLSIDGVAIERLLEREEPLRSGSPQWKRLAALSGLGRGAKGTTAAVKVERGGKTLELQVPRDLPRPLVEPRPESFTELRPGVMYVDLTAVEMPAIEARISDLAAARGIVFDLRGYPKGNHAVLQHLADEPLQSARWQVPRIIYPDRQRLAGYDVSGRWRLEPKTPRLEGKIVFLTDARAISYAESVMGIVEHYRLAEIVGSPTAGTNGNMNAVVLPGGFRISFTGMRVLKHDDSQHHLIGIRPTVSATPTLRGIRAGKDEVLDKALELIDGDGSEQDG